MAVKFTPQFLDDLRARLPLSQVVGGVVHLKKSGTTIKGLCPFHKEKSPSFTVNDQKGFYHCFGCGAGGDIFDFIINTQRLTFPEAVEKVADACGIPLPKDLMDQSKDLPRKNWYNLLEDACQWFESHLHSPSGRDALSYLQAREVPLKLIKLFRLGYAPSGKGLETHLTKLGHKVQDMLAVGLLSKSQERGDTYPKFRDRLMFPICDRRGRVIAFGGRILGEGQPKYLNSPESPIFHKGKTLYNYHQALKFTKQDTPLIVCEGYMDVIALWKAGYESGVAPLGTAMGEDQIEEVWRSCPEPILCFDGDAAGQKAALRVAQRATPMLVPGYSLRFATLPKGEDPDTLVRAGKMDILATLLDKATSLSAVLWQSLVDEAQPTTPERQALLFKLIGKLTASIKDTGVRISYQQVLRDRYFTAYGSRKTVSQKGASATSQSRFDPELLQYKLLLSAVLNHPAILHEVIEKFCNLNLPIAELENLRHEIIHWAEENESLDRGGLHSHLSSRGYLELMDSLLREDLYIHGKFASPHASDEQALDGWKDIYKTMVYARQTNRDISQIKQRLSETMSESTWQQLKELKKVSIDESDA